MARRRGFSKNSVAEDRERIEEMQFRKFADDLTVSRISYKPNHLLVFLDESGDVVMNKKNPFYACGGFSIMANLYGEIIPEWTKLKQDVFNLRTNELFHASEVLHRLGDNTSSLEKVENFLNLIRKKYMVQSLCGWQTPELHDLYGGGSYAKNMSSVSPLAVIQSTLEQIYPLKMLYQNWILERSDALSWRQLVMIMSGERFAAIARPHGEYCFVEKKKNSLPGLEVADLFCHLFWKMVRQRLNLVPANFTRHNGLLRAAFPRDFHD